jgi:hypothetical protein
MTQIIAAITPEYVLAASDRRLTYVTGPFVGQVKEEQSCKLICVCGTWGIAYTGLAELEGRPTHEWIAVRLAERNCLSGFVAAQILVYAAAVAMRTAPKPYELTFVIVGWSRAVKDGIVRPEFLLVSNMFDADQRRRPKPGPDFHFFKRRALQAYQPYGSQVIGQPLRPDRGRTGWSPFVAAEPTLENAAFCYFDPAYFQFHQHGPTFTCGDSAMTDVETENDPSRDYQSSSIRILWMPPKGTSSAD